MGCPATGWAFGGKTVNVAAPAAANFVGRIGSPALIGTWTILPMTSSALVIAAGGASSVGNFWTLRSAAVSAVRVGMSCDATSTSVVCTGGGASVFEPELYRNVPAPARTAMSRPTMSTRRARRRERSSTVLPFSGPLLLVDDDRDPAGEADPRCALAWVVREERLQQGHEHLEVVVALDVEVVALARRAARGHPGRIRVAHEGVAVRPVQLVMRAGVGVRRVQAGAAAAAAGPDVPVGEVRRVRSAIHAQDAPRRDDAVEQSVVPRRVVLGLGLRVVVDVDGRPPPPFTDGVVDRRVG